MEEEKQPVGMAAMKQVPASEKKTETCNHTSLMIGDRLTLCAARGGKVPGLGTGPPRGLLTGGGA